MNENMELHFCIAPNADGMIICVDQPLPLFQNHDEKCLFFEAQAKRLAKTMLAHLPQGVFDRLVAEMVMLMTTSYQTKREVE